MAQYSQDVGYIWCHFCFQEVKRRTWYRRHKNGDCVKSQELDGNTSHGLPQVAENYLIDDHTIKVSQASTRECEKIMPKIAEKMEWNKRKTMTCDSLPAPDLNSTDSGEKINISEAKRRKNSASGQRRDIDHHSEHADADASYSNIQDRASDRDDVTEDVIPDDWQQLSLSATKNEDMVELYVEQGYLQQEQKLHSLITWILFLGLWIQTHYHISDGGAERILQVFYEIMIATVGLSNSNMLDRVMQPSTFYRYFPTTLYRLYKWLDIERDDFERFVCCPTCYKLYTSMDKLKYRNRRGEIAYRRCFNRSLKSGVCNSVVVNQKKLRSGKLSFFPLHTYCYKPIISSLEKLLQIPGFEDKCELWRNRNVPENVYADVFDGKVWKDFIRNGFLTERGNYGLQMNVDWFQPFENKPKKSIGVIYLVVMNLPREDRYKADNAIVLSIIPDLPKEPETLVTFLEPLVNELLSLWNYGSKVKTHKHPEGLKIKCALLCATCDIPAARKVGGFLSHMADKGCSKCLHSFGGGRNRNCGGFEKDKWTPRTWTQHIKHLIEIRAASTFAKRSALETKYGLRDGPLNKLPYFNPVRFLTIDPMHNLFLGTAKRMWKVWTNKDHDYRQTLLVQKDIDKIDENLHHIKGGIPAERAPLNIGSHAGTWTAYEWMNWTLYASSYSLRGILDQKHLECWELFVSACRKFVQPCITRVELKQAEAGFLKFCKQTERLYETKVLTPNMHLHNHLHECANDYGSVYGFWLFTFERYNGKLGDYITNQRNIEPQLMRKVLIFKALETTKYKLPKEFEKSFLHIIDKEIPNKKSLLHSLYVPSSDALYCEGAWADLSGINFLGTAQISALDFDELSLLLKTYNSMYPSKSILMDQVCMTYLKFGRVNYGSELFSSCLSHAQPKDGRVMSSWYDQARQKDFRPCEIKYFMKHDLKIEMEYVTHVFAVVKWLKKSNAPNPFIEPWTEWKSGYENPSFATYLPIQKIFCKYAMVDEGGKVSVTPLRREVHL